ncbi:MAG: PqqD family peptide modification chaperone [Cyanobacteria bacterium P01_A01_bin.40]
MAENQASSNVDEETIILNLKSGAYYGLNNVGVIVWNLIQEPKTVKEIRDTILEEYDVESEQCSQDLFRLLKELSVAGLIKVKNETHD